jgi:antitoxin (DNA-binding transcriptional repressor) of toxin-antitoxin stability system
MTNVTEKDLQTYLDSILTRAQSERVVISRRGKPCAVLVGVEGHDVEDLELATSEDFGRMIEGRRIGGKSLPLAEVEARIGIASAKPPGKRSPVKRARKRP